MKTKQGNRINMPVFKGLDYERFLTNKVHRFDEALLMKGSLYLVNNAS